MIELVDVSKVYSLGRVQVPALRGVSLTVADGEFVAVMGPSGSGKSTLLHLMGCLDTPTSGRVLFRGRDVSGLPDRELARLRAADIGFVFQTFNLLPDETALGNVELPLLYSGVADRRSRAREALEKVGLADRLDHRPLELSGGEQQRVAIARAIVRRPSVILADEPTGNLDTESGRMILDLFCRLNAEGVAVVMVTHDAEVAERASRTIRLRDGRVESCGG